MCLVLARELSSKTKRRLVVAGGFRRRKNSWIGFALNTAFAKLLRGACGGGKPAHLIAFFFGCFAEHGKGRCLPGSRATLQTDDPISATKNLLNGRLLMSV